MAKTPFNNASIIISLILVIPQFALYLVGSLTSIDRYVDNIAWYQFSATLVQRTQFFLGLDGYVAQTPTISTFIPYDSQELSFSNNCQAAGFNGVILTSIATAFSFFLFIVIASRLSTDDLANRFDICFVLSLITFGLGLGAYVNFYDRCVQGFNSYIENNGFNAVDRSLAAGGASMVAAIVLNFIILSITGMETFGQFCGVR